MRKNVDFGVVFGSQNDEKSIKNGVEKCVFFLLPFSGVFLRFFEILLDFGRPKNFQKSIKNRKNRVRDDFVVRLKFMIVFGVDSGAILVDFGWILEGF